MNTNSIPPIAAAAVATAMLLDAQERLGGDNVAFAITAVFAITIAFIHYQGSKT